MVLPVVIHDFWDRSRPSLLENLWKILILPVYAQHRSKLIGDNCRLCHVFAAVEHGMSESPWKVQDKSRIRIQNKRYKLNYLIRKNLACFFVRKQQEIWMEEQSSFIWVLLWRTSQKYCGWWLIGDRLICLSNTSFTEFIWFPSFTNWATRQDFYSMGQSMGACVSRFVLCVPAFPGKYHVKPQRTHSPVTYKYVIRFCATCGTRRKQLF